MPYQQAPVRNSHSTSVSVRPYGGAPVSQARPRPNLPQAQRPKAHAIPVKKRRRKEKEYFFIMRRGVCFLLLLFSIIWIAVIALNYLNILPNYTSFVIEKDLTPLDERLEIDTGELDDDGNAIMLPYTDQSVYVSMMDPIYGGIAAILNKPMVDGGGVSLSPFYDEIYHKIMDTPAEEEGDNDGIDPAARTADSMMMIAQIAFPYFPLALALSALGVLILLLISLFALFGRRIFKGFFILALILVIAGVLTFIAADAAAGIFMGNPVLNEDGTVVSVIDFTRIVEFLTGAFTPAPLTAIDPEIAIEPLPLVAGYGTLALLVLPIIMLLLSFFVKRKVPYSIFDK